MRLAIYAKPCGYDKSKKGYHDGSVSKGPMPRGRYASINSPATELDNESDGELGELEEMRETEFVGDVDAAASGWSSAGEQTQEESGTGSLVGAVDVLVRVGKRTLDGKDGGVSGLLPGGVIAASVTALGLDVRNREVLLDQSLVELRQLVVGEIGDDADFLPGSPLDPGGHVELAHSDDLDTAGPVVLGDGLGAQKTSLLNNRECHPWVIKQRLNGPQQNTSGTRQYG